LTPPRTFEVSITHGAERDLEDIHAYLAVHRGTDEADLLLDAFLAKIETLECYPLRGSIPSELDALGIRDFRQIILPPHRIIYRVIDSRVFIVLIADGRRDMQSLLERRLLGAR